MNTKDAQKYINDLRMYIRNITHEIDQLQRVVFNQNHKNTINTCTNKLHIKSWQYVGCHGEEMECTICEVKVGL